MSLKPHHKDGSLASTIEAVAHWVDRDNVEEVKRAVRSNPTLDLNAPIDATPWDIHASRMKRPATCRILHLARSPAMVRLLTASGATVDARDSGGRTSLFWRLPKTDDTLEALLAAGADINTKDDAGQTALMMYAGYSYKDNSSHIGLLLKAGAEVDVRDAEGQSPFYRAAAAGRPWLMQLLLDRGADPKVQAKDGTTALHVAVNSLDAVDLLLEQGVDPDVMNAEGETALATLAELLMAPRLMNEWHAVACRLLDHGATPPLAADGTMLLQAAADWQRANGLGDYANRLHAALEKNIASRTRKRGRALKTATTNPGRRPKL